ncbi:POTE ankyrin domain family member A-like [Nycticebus coucang]|uniref:POTE ankyrin domain family member A-like n=1 Tax=Nycticebus coucang TaxID=9470 RepID=UPI00234DC71F|nr:POTE ankyrin domain family member A-like [Nycticebus coucang]
MGDNEDRTPLMKAIQHQETECAFNLLDYGADPNVTDDYSNTALHYAVYSGNIVLITKLLSCGANIETKNKKQLTPLLLAINGQNLKMVEFLVKNKADINAVDKYESLAQAHIPVMPSWASRCLEGGCSHFYKLHRLVGASPGLLTSHNLSP